MTTPVKVDATILTKKSGRDWSRVEIIRLGSNFDLVLKKGDAKVVAVLGHHEKPAIEKVLLVIGGDFECAVDQIPVRD